MFSLDIVLDYELKLKLSLSLIVIDTHENRFDREQFKKPDNKIKICCWIVLLYLREL